MIKVTDSAKSKFKDILKQDNKEDAYIRLYISGAGWGGPQFGLALDESFDDEKDTVEQVDSLHFVFENKVSDHIEGKILDYITGANEGFTLYSEKPDKDCDGGCCH